MGPPVDPVTSDARLPAEADVVIIGGGIIGVCAALHLVRKGVTVVLCEKGTIAGEQSGRNWGWVRKLDRDPREIPLIVESLRQWERMNETIGDDTGFRAAGIAFAADGEADIARHEAWLEQARPYQIDARMISGAELDRHVPGASGRWKTALFCPTDGRAEPQMAAPAMARAARRAGATILTGCAVRGLERSGGRVSAVVTERGRIRTTTAVLAGGAWSRRFLRDLDVSLPQLKVRSSVMRTAPLVGGPEAAFWFAGAAYRKRRDGGYTIADGHVNVVPDSIRFLPQFWSTFLNERKSLKLRLDGRFAREWTEARPVPLDRPSPYEATRVLDPAPDRAVNRAALRRLAAAFPAFAKAEVVQEWAGMIDVTPDAVPVISPVDAVPGLIVATGFSGHGFGIGPGAGRLVADLVTGAAPVVDPHDFRLSRFSDGSKRRVLSGL
ncbi:FAD-binding oxidoreductase [Lichenihabitans sp. Uapishka_5]|uniref:NAD(P)/FAD-dependent oxidoreductase n=1 Tax=Lichenihabitans sp. Uapishka_5 TaxID=3037302 RepID=UPI0029E7FAB2|nr:FAD-binding oxidoreductase [Lichenihabitans sp. Uapishka_5]MDX7951537.1 FAD-binding oxidoreductase [Lichenihabitans sp. Uapishka_5]